MNKLTFECSEKWMELGEEAGVFDLKRNGYRINETGQLEHDPWIIPTAEYIYKKLRVPFFYASIRLLMRYADYYR